MFVNFDHSVRITHPSNTEMVHHKETKFPPEDKSNMHVRLFLVQYVKGRLSFECIILKLSTDFENGSDFVNMKKLMHR